MTDEPSPRTNPPVPANARKAGLKLDEIVRAAVAIADGDGLDALSMRRVAERIGAGVMSLYRHVADKDQLIGLAIDAVYADEAFPEPAPANWRDRMRESAFRQWRCYGKHPWIVPLISLVRPQIGANGMREMEWAFEGLQDLPLSGNERLRMFLVVRAFVHGAAAQAVTEAADERQTGLATREWWRAQSKALGDIFSSGRFPLISALGPNANPSPDTWFEFGLDCLLDGLELQAQSNRE